MQRIPEPELMDDMNQALAYDQADFSASHGKRVNLFIEKLGASNVIGKVLDLGCGSGDILQRFATAFPSASFIGIDGSDVMLQLAKQRMTRTALESRVQFIHTFIPTDSIPKQEYAVIMSHSLLHHLPNPAVLWQTMLDCSKSDTFIFVADLCRPVSKEMASHAVDAYAAGAPKGLRDDFYNSLCAAYTPDEVEGQLITAKLPLRVQKVSDIHMIVYGKKPPTP